MLRELRISRITRIDYALNVFIYTSVLTQIEHGQHGHFVAYFFRGAHIVRMLVLVSRVFVDFHFGVVHELQFEYVVYNRGRFRFIRHLLIVRLFHAIVR